MTHIPYAAPRYRMGEEMYRWWYANPMRWPWTSAAGQSLIMIHAQTSETTRDRPRHWKLCYTFTEDLVRTYWRLGTYRGNSFHSHDSLHSMPFLTIMSHAWHLSVLVTRFSHVYCSDLWRSLFEYNFDGSVRSRDHQWIASDAQYWASD